MAAMTERFTSSWASGRIGVDPAEALKPLEDGLTVRLIAIPRNALRTCSCDEGLAAVVDRNNQMPEQFDFIPVTDVQCAERPPRIIGLIELVPFHNCIIEQHQLIRDQMRPLSEDNLIGADAGILAFVRDADRHRCRLVVSGCEISGLVSLSDLQKLPVRAALFTMVTHLEMVMASFIRRECSQGSEWLGRLSENRQQMLRIEIENAKRNDSFVDELLFTQFADKITIIKKSPLIGSNKSLFRKELERVRELRDALAHANVYAANRESAIRVCETTRMMDRWIDELTLSSTQGDSEMA
jgi:hypothetical protein